MAEHSKYVETAELDKAAYIRIFPSFWLLRAMALLTMTTSANSI